MTHTRIDMRRDGVAHLHTDPSPTPTREQVGITSPFEDEFAIANLCGLSPYMGAIFPRQYHNYERSVPCAPFAYLDDSMDKYRCTAVAGASSPPCISHHHHHMHHKPHTTWIRYLSFRDVSAAELAAWKRTIVWFFKKVLYRHQVGPSVRHEGWRAWMGGWFICVHLTHRLFQPYPRM